MSLAYNNYLDQHIANVGNAYAWIKEYLPEVTAGIAGDDEWNILKRHDESKYDREEYDAYDAYFYGKTKTTEIEEDFKYALLHHIHNNSHHWRYYLLISDEPSEGIVALDMPYCDIVHMVCDWWSFSFKTGNLREIFKWYNVHRKYMKLSDNTREIVEDILGKIATKLDELESKEDESEGVDN